MMMTEEAVEIFMVMNAIELGMNETAEEAHEVDGTNIGEESVESSATHIQRGNRSFET